jgi:ABC-type lipoprotein export system ATPase subunit
MVTHKLEIAAYCKRIIAMRDGRVLRDESNPPINSSAPLIPSADPSA